MPSARDPVRLAPSGVQPAGSYLAYIALGANLGDARATLQQALQDLARLPQTWGLRASSCYRTAPIDSSGPDYINAVAEVHTRLSPHDLLEALQAQEQAQGRVRPYPNAPRTLDLDILTMHSTQGEVVLSDEQLTLPHPRMTARAFVLVPLAEISPGRVSPQQLEAVADQAIERLA